MSEFSNFARMPERKLRQVNLDDIIQNQVNIQKIANKNIEFKIKINKKKNTITCDFNQINRLFMNVLKNSIESISKKKKKFIYQFLINQNLFVLILKIMETVFQ